MTEQEKQEIKTKLIQFGFWGVNQHCSCREAAQTDD